MSTLRDALIDDLGKWYRKASIQIAVLGGVFCETWDYVPSSLRDKLPHDMQTHIATITFALVVIARLIKQPAPPVTGDDHGDH
jgi:hypothetical protein